MEAEIRTHLKDKYAINDIEYINVSWNIQDLHDASSELELNFKRLDVIESFMHDQNISREEFKALDPKEHKDYPKEKKTCHGSTNLNLDDVESNIE